VHGRLGYAVLILGWLPSHLERWSPEDRRPCVIDGSWWRRLITAMNLCPFGVLNEVGVSLARRGMPSVCHSGLVASAAFAARSVSKRGDLQALSL